MDANSQQLGKQLSQQPSLGLWHQPEANYSFGLGQRGSIAAVTGLIAILFAFVPSADRLRNVTIVTIIVAVVLVGFLIRDRWGRTLYAIGRFEIGWWWHRLTGRTFYSPVWFSATPVTKSSLPGLLADVSIVEHRYNNTVFGLVIQPVSSTATALFECNPVGVEMLTPEEANQYKQRWDRWLSATCQEPDIVSIQTVTQATAGDRAQLANAVTNLVKRPGSASTELLDGIQTALNPSDRPVCRTWVAVSWRTRRRDLHANVLAARIGRIHVELAECGAGKPVPLTKNAIHRTWAEMWDPDRRAALAEYPNQVVALSDVIPATQERRQALAIGDYEAITMAMGEMPHGVIGTKALHQLAQGVPDTNAVRWAELWRPVRPTEARSWLAGIERGIETRLALGENRRRQKVKDEVDETHHRTMAVALVEGANLVRFGLAITATYPTTADRAAIIERIRQLTGPLSVQLRVHNGAHLPGFIATLP
ncbi:MAG: hypothetical protein OER95_06370, partial [Acidimicrobiia bacterium]|nr:hypothetical protein [Acidimicrobiia bacterium]